MFRRMQYLGSLNACGFTRDHVYDTQTIDRPDAPGIVITSDFDVTEDKEVDLYMPFGSEIGIKSFFKEVH